MTIATLKTTIEKLKAKLADPRDGDDKRWVERWLKRCESRLAKKTQNFEHKHAFARKRRREPEAALPGEEL
jgi:hypothetical protein